MTNVSRPFWQILLIIIENNEQESLTCDECTAMMEYLADRAIEGANLNELKIAAFSIFRFCGACKNHYQKHIQELEEKVRSKNKSIL